MSHYCKSCDETRGLYASYERELENLRAELAAVTACSDAQDQTIAILAKERDASRAELATVTAERNEARSDRLQLQEELDAERTEVDLKQAALAECSRTLAETQAALQDIE